jgi:putative oxidoreductase
MLQGIFGGLASWGPDFIRLGVAFTFILHGYPKLFGPKPGPKGFAGYVGSMGFPSPLFFAYAAGITEFVGGVCILLGFLTRFWALLGAIEFLTIILKVKWSKGFLISNEGWEWDWAILMMLLSLLVTGPGRLALDHAIRTGL